jgi:hypothetical protein
MSWKNLPEDTSNYIGFVYLIRNNHPEVVNDPTKKRFYIGKKQLLKRVKRKPLKGKTRNRITFKDNDVDKYWGSSKELLNDIEKFGIEHFSREVIELCHSKFHMTYGEISWQIKCNVLFDERFYNSILNCRIAVVPKGFVDIERNPDTLNL